jgi:hypothetical protein
MTRYTPEQRLFLYLKRENRVSYRQIDFEFQQKFNIPAPTNANIRSIHFKISTEFTAHNLHRGRSGRKRSERRDENYLRVMGDVLQTPKLGIRKRAPSLDMTRMTVQRILKELQQKPYHMTRRHQLLQPDYQNRMNWANDFLAKQTADPYYEDSIWWTDEAHCHLNGYVNTHNSIHWGSVKPTEVIQKPLHPIKVTVWCAMSSAGILGPFFYEENGRTVTVNGARYLDLLQNEFYPDLTQFAFLNPDEDPNSWNFMQDGARPHIVRGVRTFLTTKFGTNTIGQYLNTHWPARSPDLTPCDFFLWGYVKDQLYQRYPITGRQQLKDHLVDIIQNINPDFLARSCRSVKKRCAKLLTVNGHHIEQL